MEKKNYMPPKFVEYGDAVALTQGSIIGRYYEEYIQPSYSDYQIPKHIEPPSFE